MIATQNPVDLSGTFPLPDSQLDRFLLRLAMGYPSAQAERELLRGTDRRDLIARAVPKLDDTQVRALREAVGQVHASDALVDYVQALLTRSRQHAGVRVGLSPRAGLALLRAARAHALLLGRGHVVPRTCRPCSWRWPVIAWWPKPSPARGRHWHEPSCRPLRWIEGGHALATTATAGTPAQA